MLKNTSNKGASVLAESARVPWIIQQVTSTLLIPEAKVNVAAAANLIRERLGRETGQQSMLQSHATRGIAQLDLIIGGPQRRGMAHRNLLLARTVLINRLFYDKTLLAQCLYNIVHHLCREIQPDRAVNGFSTEGGCIDTIQFTRQVKFVLKGSLDPDASLTGLCHDILQKRARARSPVQMIVIQLITEQARATRRPGQHTERLRVRHKTNLAHRFHALHLRHLV